MVNFLVVDCFWAPWESWENCKAENNQCLRRRNIQTEAKGGHPCKADDAKMQCPPLRCGNPGMYIKIHL